MLVLALMLNLLQPEVQNIWIRLN